MLKKILLILLTLLFFNAVVAADDAGLHYPHYDVNNITCFSCHYAASEDPPEWYTHEPQDIDDTPYNNLCRSCHNDVIAPNVNPHSSLTTSNQYHLADGGWGIECRECHWPHHQYQTVAYGSASYLYSGISTNVTGTSLTESGAGWNDDQFNGNILIPNIYEPSYNYLIIDTSSDTLTVESTGSHPEPIDLTRTAVGDTFAIIYGKLIRPFIPTPYSGYKQVRFFKTNGANSYADGDSTYDGVCEVCHTEANHFRNTGEVNGGAGGYDHTSAVATNCITCHPHTAGFSHGGGVGGGTCEECHGHDEGYGGFTGGKGSFVAHSTHTENDTDDLKGPNISCYDCHETDKIPYFKSGNDSNEDGFITLDETDVCNTCHSPEGTYDGVDDVDVGAKNNWHSAIYETDGGGLSTSVLQAGKEKWCVTCHDESASVIDSITAPNIAGDEDGDYTYGTGWGYYKTGHGLAADEAYPYKGGLLEPPLVGGAAKPVNCDSCHDFSTAHIDGTARTFDDANSSATDPSTYRQGYRLKLVDGEEPMIVPWMQHGGNPDLYNGTEIYRLCVECHDSTPYTDSFPAADGTTNLVTDGTNRHYHHLRDDLMNTLKWSADWDFSVETSRMTCVSCHNVHGSTRLAMVRDGKLIGREPGLQIWYNNDSVVFYETDNAEPPDPADLPLIASEGTVWIGNSSVNLCSHCHGDPNTKAEYRTPFQDVAQPPTLTWTGENGYDNDGVNPNSGPTTGSFLFRVTYTDLNNDAPTTSQLLIDRNDNDSYEDNADPALDEIIDMVEANSGDDNHIDGKIYTYTLDLAKDGDNTFTYTFNFADSDGAATGAPVDTGGTVTITNNAPILSWTDEEFYEGSGVYP